MASDKNTFMKYIIIILVILAINIIGGYIIAKKILDYTYDTDNFSESEVESEEGGNSSELGEQTDIMVTLDAINLNPANSSGEIFSCEIVLEVNSEEDKTDLTTRNPQVMDTLANYLSLKTVSELADASKWDQYRREMIELINSLFNNDKINNLYIKQKIIQFE